LAKCRGAAALGLLPGEEGREGCRAGVKRSRGGFAREPSRAKLRVEPRFAREDSLKASSGPESQYESARRDATLRVVPTFPQRVASGPPAFLAIPCAVCRLRDLNAVFFDKAETIPPMTHCTIADGSCCGYPDKSNNMNW